MVFKKRTAHRLCGITCVVQFLNSSFEAPQGLIPIQGVARENSGTQPGIGLHIEKAPATLSKHDGTTMLFFWEKTPFPA